MHHQQTHVTDFDTVFHEFAQLVDVYATQQRLPTTMAAALNEVHAVMEEIELYHYEGHTPVHHDIVWRIGYLVFCLHLVERCDPPHDGAARSLVTRFLDQMGVSVACAIEIALVRLRSLCRGEDIVHVDTYVLVPIMKRSLAHRA